MKTISLLDRLRLENEATAQVDASKIPVINQEDSQPLHAVHRKMMATSIWVFSFFWTFFSFLLLLLVFCLILWDCKRENAGDRKLGPGGG